MDKAELVTDQVLMPFIAIVQEGSTLSLSFIDDEAAADIAGQGYTLTIILTNRSGESKYQTEVWIQAQTKITLTSSFDPEAIRTLEVVVGQK